ncbi:MAG: tyrosine-protein phosphatase [Aquincola tertiaricarbonis]|uniref:tyrosine-protein phosphatase n=1 Tax=Aquincola tertiaricarbonis TaxID=391953 RepID=UPI000614C90C|nr:CpsB/CapC family capsule biosynthesis tyrosine phosphatase [Aquincola tertiaricarbonis]
MIDLHCHLLPGIDDGPPTLQAALALGQACVDDGITHAVATPHVFPGRFENRASSIEEAFAAFQAAVSSAGLPLQLGWAGEVRLTPEVLDLLDRDELPFLGRSTTGQRTLLLEMPDGQVPLGSQRFVELLLQRGVRPVLAHPERNRALMDQPQRLAPFVAQGCAVQLTAGSLVGGFGSRAQQAAETMLEAGWVHAIASDAHNLAGRRPRMREAAAWLQQHYGPEVAHRLTVTGPAALCGLSPPAPVAQRAAA